ncbi:Swt1 family HEPN domain-containing protein [uncultured Arcticibacterium sp.]|uniref:Swt1 family HEPN domain-containing protein n=1 Tax=uncultured Arcticibacterium sp. TaxID=2173042 RepID=UPI0030FCDA24
MDKLEALCKLIDLEKISKLDVAIALIWFHCVLNNEQECDVKKINEYFEAVNLPKYNVTYLKRGLAKSKKITKGKVKGTFKLVRKTKLEHDERLSKLFEANELSVETTVDLSLAPFLDASDVTAANKMAELYVVIHCYENSVRRLIERTFLNSFGSNWWDTVSNSGMKKKYEDRKAKEGKNKWLSPRGNGVSPLYYLDWSDLVALFRKNESTFEPIVRDLRFVELRLEELEKTRNIVAHNGVLPSIDDFQRLKLSFKDWCKQIDEKILPN